MKSPCRDQSGVAMAEAEAAPSGRAGGPSRVPVMMTAQVGRRVMPSSASSPAGARSGPYQRPAGRTPVPVGRRRRPPSPPALRASSSPSGCDHRGPGSGLYMLMAIAARRLAAKAAPCYPVRGQCGTGPRCPIGVAPRLKARRLEVRHLEVRRLEGMAPRGHGALRCGASR